MKSVGKRLREINEETYKMNVIDTDERKKLYETYWSKTLTETRINYARTEHKENANEHIKYKRPQNKEN